MTDMRLVGGTDTGDNKVKLSGEDAEAVLLKHFKVVAIDVLTRHRSGESTIEDVAAYFVSLFKSGVVAGREIAKGNDVALDFGE
jgi:hypothetical protein